MASATHNVKCPCCNNPWGAATGDFFAKFCMDCEEEPQKGVGVSRSNMDFDVHPKDNFYLYSNGNWLKNNPIPSGYPNWNSFLTLHVKSQENLKQILTELAESADITEDERKLSTFYKAAMDEDAIEDAGIKALEAVLAQCQTIVDSMGDKSAFAQNLGTIALKYGVNPFISIGVSPDKMDSDHSIAQISQGGIGLPDRDYYFDEDKADKREAYKKCIAMMLTLLEDVKAQEPTADNMALATKVYDLEFSLAEAHMTRTENRDPHETYNKMSIAELSSNGDGSFDFASYFLGATGKTAEGLGDINVRNTKAVDKAAEVASAVEPPVLLAYLRWKTACSSAPYLSKAFVDTHFEFFEKTLSGTSEIKPRWKRAMAFTESALGEALGKIYCAKYFDESSKERALHIVEQVRQSLEARLKEVDWIKADSTRNEALKKMGRFRVKIGYPDKWIDYTSLDIAEGEPFLDLIFKAREFESTLEIAEMNAPTDKSKWFMTPQTINAYYHPSLNEIVFPAAILQHPFFDKDADDAINFGAMGAVVGHEMTHAFDDKGRKFDFSGVLNDWWTEEDGKEYDKRVEVMVEQANKYEVYGRTVQGKLTSGENIADLGGLRLALRSLKASDSFDEASKIDGFTPVQRFFLSWAQCWRQNITKERSLQLLTIDPHGPNELRCNGPLSNMSEFHAAFEVKEGDPMFKPTSERVNIW